jgi:hypothetical protein
MSQDELTKAAQLLRKSEEELVQRCSTEIELVLNKHNCTMIPQIIIRGGQIIPHVLIVPKKAGLSHSRLSSRNGGDD